jgi:hypothetical protein
MPRFVDADERFLAWASEHNDGFVLNIERSLNPAESFIHRATCTNLIDKRVQPAGRTTSWIKVCSNKKEDLVAWLRVEADAEPRLCSRCRP